MYKYLIHLCRKRKKFSVKHKYHCSAIRSVLETRQLGDSAGNAALSALKNGSSLDRATIDSVIQFVRSNGDVPARSRTDFETMLSYLLDDLKVENIIHPRIRVGSPDSSNLYLTPDALTNIQIGGRYVAFFTCTTRNKPSVPEMLGHFVDLYSTTNRLLYNVVLFDDTRKEIERNKKKAVFEKPRLAKKKFADEGWIVNPFDVGGQQGRTVHEVAETKLRALVRRSEGDGVRFIEDYEVVTMPGIYRPEQFHIHNSHVAAIRPRSF